LPGGTTNTLSSHRRSVTIIHRSPASGKARSWYNQVLSSCDSLLSDCAWHGQPQNPFHAPGGICAKGGEESDPRKLSALKGRWKRDPNIRNAKMLWAASCLCFFGFLRSGEITCPSERTFDSLSNLCFSDVRVDNRSSPSWLQVSIKASKTDPFRQGVTLHIGVAGGPLCPVAAILSYMVARGCAPGPLFTWGDNRYLTRDGFVAGVRSALQEAGYVAKDYAGHSFRIGAATTASRCGIQDSLIKTLGRWESSAYTRYIRTPPDVLRGVAKVLSKDQSSS